MDSTVIARRAIVFANGPLVDPERDRAWVRGDELILAADGGARHARAFGLTPHVVIGDMDSLPPAEQASLEQAGTRFERFSSDKNETDLELALLYAVRAGVEEIVVLGALGGRIDQELANLLLLALPALAQVRVWLVAGGQRATLVRDEVTLAGRAGDVVSLLPLGGDVEGVVTEGLAWPLHGETLRLGFGRGVSNRLCAERARVRLRSGLLWCVALEQEEV